MANIKTIAGFYYIGLVIGFFNKKDVVDWADHGIENYEIPYEIIEVSLSQRKSLEDIASLLKTISGVQNLMTAFRVMLGFMIAQYVEAFITVDELFTYINKLQAIGSTFEEDEELLYELDRMSDDFYLATEGIYGDIEQVVVKATNKLMTFNGYLSFALLSSYFCHVRWGGNRRQ